MESKPQFDLVRRDFETSKDIIIPDVTPGKKIRLVRADSAQAYFIDSEGQGWYFQNSERLWRPLTAQDLSPMATQFTQEYKSEITEFDSVEAAALNAIKISFVDTIDLYDPSDQGFSESLREVLRVWIEKCKKVVDCIEKIEKELDGDTKKVLLQELETYIKEAEDAEKGGLDE